MDFDGGVEDVSSDPHEVVYRPEEPGTGHVMDSGPVPGDVRELLARRELFQLIARTRDLEVISDDLFDGDDFEDAVSVFEKLLPHLDYSFDGAF